MDIILSSLDLIYSKLINKYGTTGTGVAVERSGVASAVFLS